MIAFDVQEMLTGAQHTGSSDGRPIEWGGLRKALDASIDPDRATTEEAYTLLVRLGQAPCCHGVLEAFARLPHVDCGIDGDLVTEAMESLPHDVVRVSPSSNERSQPMRGSSVDRSELNSRSEASSVLLGSGEIATLAAKLDPLRRVDHAFAALEKAFGDEKSKAQHRRFFRSPLHGYATARRFRGWHDKLEATGNSLATIRLRLGRRGQDLLTETRAAVAPAVTTAVRVAADELIAEATALAAKTAQRQVDSSGRNGFDCRDVLTARVHLHAPIPERSERAIRAFDGWGYYGRMGNGQKTGVGDSAEAGEAVAVLQVSPEPGRHILDTDRGFGRAFVDNMALTVSLLSVPDLREHPGLMKFYPGAKVIVDDCDSAAGGSGDCAAGGTPLRIVCERLQGWRSLRDVILERGPLAPPSAIATGDDGGLRVLRLWGRQLALILECLASRSLVLRDLRASTIFVSPDGSKVKVVSFSSLATLTSLGEISPKAPCLDDHIHGPSKPLTPPEALAIRSGRSESSGHVAHDGGKRRNVKYDDNLVLADDEGAGAFRATTAWDTWTYGVLLFELAFGVPPPAFGASLGRAVAALTEISVAKDAPAPDLGDVARVIEYDFLSVARGHPTGGNTEDGLPSFPRLAEELGRTPLGAAAGVRKSLHPSITEPESVSIPSHLTNNGVKAVDGFRRAWVRRQLQREESGAVDVVTWQMFQDKLKRHLNASVAATASLMSRQVSGKILSQGGDEGGGRRLGLDDDPGSSATSKQIATGAMAVDRVKARLSAADNRELGWLPIRFTLGVVREELQLSFSAIETEFIAACLEDGAPRCQEGNREVRGNGLREGDVFYPPLLYVLLDSLTPLLELQTVRAGQAIPLPIPISFKDLLRACLEPDPDRRPRPGDLRHLPFLVSEDCTRDNESLNDDDISAASAYISGSGNACSLVWTFRERVERRIQACENAGLNDVASDAAVHSKTKDKDKLKGSWVAAGKQRQHIGRLPSSGAGELAEALKELQRLVHREPNHCFVDDPLQARRMARGYAKLIDEVFESGVLVRATALALRFQDREEVRHVLSKQCRTHATVGVCLNSMRLLS